MFGFLKRKKTKEIKIRSCKGCPFYHTWLYHGNDCDQHECTVAFNKWAPCCFELIKAHQENRIADKCPLKDIKVVVFLDESAQ